MPKYTCTRCGETAYSKNIVTRNVFPDNFTVSMLQGQMYTKVVDDPLYLPESGRKDLVFHITKHKDETQKDAIDQFFKTIRSLDENEIKMLACAMDGGHQWHSDDPPEV